MLGEWLYSDSGYNNICEKLAMQYAEMGDNSVSIAMASPLILVEF